MPMVWATRNGVGTAAHISEVSRGLGCDCVCPGCQAQLEAVNSENPYWKKHPHFRHHNAPESLACEEAAVTKAAKQALSEVREFQLPDDVVIGEAKSAHGKLFSHRLDQPGPVLAVTQYTSVDATDAILTLADGQMIYVRLIATGIPLTGEPPKQTKFAEVIIDISDPVLRTANREVLRQHISLNPEQRRWCSNHDLAGLQAQANATAQSLANAYVPLSSDPREKLKALRALFEERARGTAALPRTRSDARTELQMIRAFYNDGAYRHYAPKIMFDVVICTGTVVTVLPLNYQARLTWAISDETCERAKALYEQHKAEKARAEEEQRKAEAAQNRPFAKTFVVAMHYIDTLDHPKTKRLMSIQAENYGFEINNLLHDKHLPDLLQSRFEEINIQAKSISYISVRKGSHGTAHVIELQ